MAPAREWKNWLSLAKEFWCAGPRSIPTQFMPIWEIAKVMGNADLGVVPKRSDSFGNEAFSTKTLEFMALSVPLLISETAVDRYYFNDRVVTFACSGDADDFGAKMVQLVRNPEAP